jgi:Uma2 family endonuclease
MSLSPPPTKRSTIDDLGAFPDDGKLRELANGAIVEWDVTTQEHGDLEAALTEHLRRYVRTHKLGRVSCGDALVSIQGSAYDARGPDIAFYRRGRIPVDRKAAATSTAPDFVIEILSPSDTASRVRAKVRDWLRAGVRLLWYIDPEDGSTTVYHGSTSTDVLAYAWLDGQDVVPGFRVRIQDLFREMEEDVE